MKNNVESDINQLSVYEQNSQYLGNQRQRFQAQLLEIDSALSEIDETKDTYKIIGNIMVKLPGKQIKEELESKKQVINVRIESIKKQEESVKKKTQELQKKVMDRLEKDNKQKK